MKIVTNRCYGGFSISEKAARFMAERGNRRAIAELAEYNKGRKKRWYGYGYMDEDPGDGSEDGYSRTDPDLVAAVEELGKDASGSCASLSVTEIPDGSEWEIDEYDGYESVHEVHRSWG